MLNSKLKICLVLFAGLLSNAFSDDMSDAIKQLTGEAGKQYIGPVVSAFGSNLNSGWYHKAPTADKFRFSFEAGLIGSGTFLGSGKKHFDVGGTFRFDTAQSQKLLKFIDTDPAYSSLSVAQRQALKDSLAIRLAQHDNTVKFTGGTIIGNKDDTVKVILIESKFATGFNSVPGMPDSILIPRDSVMLKGVAGVLKSFKSIPFPGITPQLSLGTVFGTNLTFRWFTSDWAGSLIPSEVPSFSSFGFGIQHNPAVWFSVPIPVDFCLGYFHQNLEVGDIFTASANAYGIDVSKQLGWRFFNVTPYAGYQYETATMSFDYDMADVTLNNGLKVKGQHVGFDLDGENHNRFTAGLSIHLGFINLNGDWNFAQYNSFSAGLMFGI